MQVLERRADGSVLCVLDADEAARIEGAASPPRRWLAKGRTAEYGVFASQKVFEHIVTAPTWQDAERQGLAMALRNCRSDRYVCEIDVKDITGKTRGLFGFWH